MRTLTLLICIITIVISGANLLQQQSAISHEISRNRQYGRSNSLTFPDEKLIYLRRKPDLGIPSLSRAPKILPSLRYAASQLEPSDILNFYVKPNRANDCTKLFGKLCKSCPKNSSKCRQSVVDDLDIIPEDDSPILESDTPQTIQDVGLCSGINCAPKMFVIPMLSLPKNININIEENTIDRPIPITRFEKRTVEFLVRKKPELG